MKKTIYLFFLLAFFAGCKKQEVTQTVKVAKVSFSNNTNPIVSVDVKYNGEIYRVPGDVPVIYGDRTFEILTKDGEKITEGRFDISGNILYYIYRPDATVKPVLITKLPPPPPSTNPLDNIEPAPEGFVKIKIKHDFLKDLGIAQIDVQVLAAVNSASVYELFTTIPNVTTTLSKDFVLVRRPVRDGAMLQQFKFRFINSLTKEILKSGTGQVYTTDQLFLNKSAYNAYLLSFYSYDISPDDTGVEHNGSFYELGPDLIDQK